MNGRIALKCILEKYEKCDWNSNGLIHVLMVGFLNMVDKLGYHMGKEFLNNVNNDQILKEYLP